MKTFERKEYSLTPREQSELHHVRKKEGEAFPFWEKVCASIGLDPKTAIIVENNKSRFTALPIGHDKDWCWPMELKCRKRYEYVMPDYLDR